LIDPRKEEERLQKKLSTSKNQLSKLYENLGRSDYERKVPIEVQEANSLKLKGLNEEIKELGDALAALKLL